MEMLYKLNNNLMKNLFSERKVFGFRFYSFILSLSPILFLIKPSRLIAIYYFNNANIENDNL